MFWNLDEVGTGTNKLLSQLYFDLGSVHYFLRI